MKKAINIQVIFYCFSVLIILSSCSSKNQPVATDVELATSWADMTNYITQHTPANTPTFASRCFGYIGLTMYESVVPGFSEYNSIAGELNGLDSMPTLESGKQYSWQLALNAGQAEIIRNIYIQTSDENKLRIDSLENYFKTMYADSIVDKSIVDRSIAFGKKIALTIFQWSTTDGGHRGYLRNFDKKLIFKQKPGSWKPPLYAQSFSHYPLHPHWGENRTFLIADSMMQAPAFISYDTTKGSDYYNQFLRVYNQEKSLTVKEKQTAIWWSDDPDETVTPPGHSYYFGTIALRRQKPDLIHCAETYARIGISISDAYRNCWKWKYQFFSERPNTFIVEHIDQQWHSFWPDPPFPAFPSGHAIQSAAAATVLEDLYGKAFAFTDSLHAGRKKDELRNTDFTVRDFTSFWQAAEETANSRFLGGIHTPQDNMAGLEQGKLIGQHVNALHWKKTNHTTDK